MEEKKAKAAERRRIRAEEKARKEAEKLASMAQEGALTENTTTATEQ